jgi:hypothetical protein
VTHHEPSRPYDLLRSVDDPAAAPSVRLLDLLLHSALRNKATFVQFAPSEKGGVVAAGNPGATTPYARVPLEAITLMIGRLKVLSGHAPGDTPPCTGTIAVQVAEEHATLAVRTDCDTSGRELATIEIRSLNRSDSRQAAT